MATVTKSIGTAGRDYSTITLWEADDYGGDGLGNDDCTGECYNDSAFGSEAAITFNASANSAKLTTPASERHDGTEGSGGRVVWSANSESWTIGITNFELSWLEIDCAGYSGNTVVSAPGNGGGCDFHHMLVHDVGGWNGEAFVMNNWNQATPDYLHNSIIYNMTGDNASERGVVKIAYDGTSMFNTTIYNTTAGGAGSYHGMYAVSGQIAAQAFQNIIIVGVDTTNSSACFDITDPDPTVSHNMSSDTSASGTGSLTSKAAANQFVSIVAGSEDLHLKTGADAIDAGTDLGTTPSGVETDIDGTDRDATGATWDMGAHELVVVASDDVSLRNLAVNISIGL